MEQKTKQGKLAALMLLQWVGVIVTNLLFYLSGSCYKLPNSSMVWYVFLTVALITLVTFIFSKPGHNCYRIVRNKICEWKNSLGGDEWPLKHAEHGRSAFITLEVALPIFAISDIVGIGLCIAETGGEISLYAPFLFIIPTIIVLVELYKWRGVFCWAVLSLIVYSCAIEISLPGFKIVDEATHLRWTIIAMGLCSLFPFLFVQTSKGMNSCPACRGTGKVS